MAFYLKSNLKNDVMGGLSAAIITLPVALGFGLTSGLGPFAGMISAIILGLLSVIFGGTDTQISTPTGSMTVVVALIVSQEIALAGTLADAMQTLVLIFALAGVFQLVLGFLRFGAAIRYVPFSVVSGFMSGIGIIIIILQIKDVFGVYDSGYSSVSSVVYHIGYFFEHANWYSVAFGLGTVACIFIVKKIKKELPASLIALVGLSLIAFLINADVKLLGPITPQSVNIWESFGLDGLNEVVIMRIVIAAISLAVLGSLNTLLTSLVADRLTQTVHNSDKELMGQGIGNLIAALFGGFPGSGATACTVANINAGGRTRLSGIVSSLVLLCVLLFASDLSAAIPKAVLGGILIHIGIIIIDFNSIKSLFKIHRVDASIMILVLLLTVFWNLVYAVILGLIFASFHFMKRMSDVVEEDTNKSRVDELVNDVIGRFNDKIIRSLIQLIVVIADIDGHTNRSRSVVEDFLKSSAKPDQIINYLAFYDDLIDRQIRVGKKKTGLFKKNSMNSVKVLKICTQVQEKQLILTKLLEYINSGKEPSIQELEFVDLVGEIFEIPKEKVDQAKVIASSEHDLPEESTRIIREIKDFDQYVLIKNLKGPVFFGFSHRFLVAMRNINPDIRVVVFNMSFVPFMDHSGARTFDEVIQFLNGQKIPVCFSGLSEENYSLLSGLNLIPTAVPEERVFKSIEDCIIWLNEPGHLENKPNR
jgi:SulP family sulfate permease